jgi:hypothetical protein
MTDVPRSPVQGVELWTPKDDWLVLRSGAYGRHTEFARVSARSRFRRGEGLPGAVWATQQAFVWRDLGTHFVRAEHAAAAGIDAALGFPCFHGRELVGVITFLLTASANSPACVEIWHHDDGLDVLRHGGGLYARTGEFEKLSKLLQFPYAAGLPGLTWSRGIPVLQEDVRASNEFVRAELARQIGLKRAVGVPLYRERRVIHVLTLIGAESKCFVRACELFLQEEQGLVSKAGFEDDAVTPGHPAPAGMPHPREALARDARLSRLPIIIPGPARQAREGAAQGSEILMALPIHDGVRLRGVICLEF